MREPWQWQEEDIAALVREQRGEDLQLEYKRSDALAKTDGKKAEITKDISAMANSAGGVVIYGVDEQKSSHGPIQLDPGIDPNLISPEWLEQVIDSGIRRRIDGIKVNPVPMASTGRLVYVVWVPESNRAPHMASDHRYYKRLGTTTAVMEEYEVRDVGRREESPDLHLDLKAWDGTESQVGVVYLDAGITNRSSEPALYATCKLYVDPGLSVINPVGTQWETLGRTELLWNGADRVGLQVLRRQWSIPAHHPILDGEQHQLGRVYLHVGVNIRFMPTPRGYKIGWEVKTPKSTPSTKGLYLIVDANGPRFDPITYTLAGI